MSKPKKINFSLIPEKDDRGKANEPYAVMQRLVREHHRHLLPARIALAWRCGWTEDKDGKMVLGQCLKASDLQRELAEYDFVILLNFEAWGDFDDSQRAALLDHELSHAAADLDEEGEQKVDERGREVWRIRKHDIEEFRDVVKRNGLYKSDLEGFARAVFDAKQTPLLKVAEEA